MRNRAFKKLILCLAVLVTAALLASCGNGGETADSATPTRGASDPDLPTPGGLIMPEDDLSGLGEYSDGPAVSDPASAEPGAVTDKSGGGQAEPGAADRETLALGEDPLEPDRPAPGSAEPGEDSGNAGSGAADTGDSPSLPEPQETRDPLDTFSFEDILDTLGDVELPIDTFD